MDTLPKPVKSDLRNAARVDYFVTQEDAWRFFEARRKEGYNASSPSGPSETARYAGLYGVWWADRPESWYYTGPAEGSDG